jgi:Phage phiEco32-like COOH.NH2 ligase-type 2
MTTNFKFSIGCDPEVFVTKRGKPASAYGILEGTKESPFKTNLGAYQVDGMAAEFNTDPVPIRDQYNYVIRTAFTNWDNRIAVQLETLKNKLKETGHSILIAPTMEFGQEFLDKQPDVAKELGCDPDFSAYTMKANPRPDGEKTFRTGAGHIHIGWGADIPVENEEHFGICAEFVKTLDTTVGMFMAYVDRDPLRRSLYGKAGAFRPKPYGVEYRTPSNVWIRNRDLRRCVYDLVQIALQDQMLNRRTTLPDLMPQEIIDTGNFAKAKEALDVVLKKDHARMRFSAYRPPAHFARVFKAVEKEYAVDAD